jgi:hypothetical protein
MDTDDLTEMAYETISRAGDVLDVLRSEIGAAAAGKPTEDEYLCGVRSHLRCILRSARDYLDSWNYLDTVDIRDFRRGVTELLSHVDKTLAAPYEQRREAKCR